MLKSLLELFKTDFSYSTKYFRKSSLKFWTGFFKTYWKFKQLPNHNSGHAAATPYTSSLTELMSVIKKD